MSEQSSVGRNSLTMAIGTAASRVTGQIRTILLAAAVGTTGLAANAYQAGSMIPQSIFTLVSGGIFNAVLVPQIVRTLKEKDAEDRLNRLVTFAVSILLGMTLLMAACTPLLTSLYVGGDSDLTALTNAFTLWCMPQIFFYGLYTVLGQILAAKNHFGMYAWSSTGANIISCIGFTIFILLFGKANDQPLAFWTQDKIALTAGMWTLGVAFQALVLFLPLFKLGFRFRPRFGARGIGLRSMGPVALGSLGVVIVSELSGIVLTRIASAAPEQAQSLHGTDMLNVAGNATYQNAFTLFILPYSLIAVSVATAMFPKISRTIADHNFDEAREDLSSALANVGLLLFFFAVAMIVYPVPIIRTLLPSVSMTEIHLIAQVLIALSLSIPAAAAILLVQRTFYAFEDGLHPFIASLVQYGMVSVLMIICRIVLQPEQWTLGIAVSVSLAYYLALPIMLLMLRRKFGGHLHMRSAIIANLKGLIAAVIAGLVVAFLAHPVTALFGAGNADETGHMNWFAALGICVVLTIVLAAVYVLVLWLLKTQQVTTAFGAILTRLGLRKGSPTYRMTETSQTTAPSDRTEPEHAMKPQLGDTLLNRYTLVSLLREGNGMSVWTASDRKLSRDCQVIVVTDAVDQANTAINELKSAETNDFGEILETEEQDGGLIVVTPLDDDLKLANHLSDQLGLTLQEHDAEAALLSAQQADFAAAETQLPVAIDNVTPVSEGESTSVIPLFDEHGNVLKPASTRSLEAEGESSSDSSASGVTPPSFEPTAENVGEATVVQAPIASTSKPTNTKEASVALMKSMKAAAMDGEGEDLSDERLLGKYSTKVVAIAAGAALILLAGLLGVLGLKGMNNDSNVTKTSTNWPEVNLDKVPFGPSTTTDTKSDDKKTDDTKSDEKKTDDNKSDQTTDTKTDEKKTDEKKSDSKTDQNTEVVNTITGDHTASGVPSPNYTNDTPIIFGGRQLLTNPGGQSGFAYTMHFDQPTDVYRMTITITTAGGHGYIRANTDGDPTQGEQVADFVFADGGTTEVKFNKIVNTQDLILWVPMDSIPQGYLYLSKIQVF